MLPIANTTVYTPVQTPLVNTAVPGSTIARVPYDNVAPSVSNAQVDNNARGNSGAAVPSEQAAPVPVAEELPALSSSASSQNFNASAQATFIAQLAGQDFSPETQSILVQYEKLVAFSDVKYKPSNATKPAPAPSGIFGRILQQEKSAPAPRVAAPIPVPPPTTSSITVSAAATVVRAPEAPAPKAPQPTNTQKSTQPASDSSAAPAEPVIIPAQVISAYTATARRGGTSSGNITDSV